jgi:hypothetical protein
MIPLVRGLYLARRVEVDPATRNLMLVDCFRTLLIERTPSAAQPFAVVAYLANGVGRYRFTLRVTRLDTMAEIYSASSFLDFPSRMEEVRFVLRVEQCLFPTDGEFEASLWVGEELLAQTPFQVKQIEEDMTWTPQKTASMPPAKRFSTALTAPSTNLASRQAI